MKKISIGKRIRCSIASLCLVAAGCITGGAYLGATADVDGGIKNTTSKDMVAHPELCMPDLGVTEGDPVISNGNIDSNEGKFAYKADIYGIDFNVQFTKATNKQVFFVLRATASGSPWGAGCKGYYALVDNMNVQVYKVDGQGGWNDEMIFSKAMKTNLFDGEMHNIKYSAVEDTDGFVKLSFTLDGVTETGKEKTKALPIEGTYFYTMDNGPNTLDYILHSDYVAPAAPVMMTAEEMVKHADLCQPELGVASGEVSVIKDGHIVSNDGKFAYKADVDGVNLNIKFTKSTNKQAFFVLRATMPGSPWGGGKGYYALADNTKIQVYKVDGVGDWNDEMLFEKDFGKSIFDGEVHNFQFMVKDNFSGFATVGVALDGVQAGVKEKTPALPKEGTYFYTMNNGAGTMDYVAYSNYVKPADPIILTAKDMIKNPTLCLPEIGVASDVVPVIVDGNIDSNESKFAYNDAVDGIDFNLKFTKATNKQVFFVLRATAPGSPWNAGCQGYYALVDGTKIQVYKVDGVGDWNDELIIDHDFGKSIFDGEVHNFKYVVKEDFDGLNRIYISLDGEAIKGKETTKALTIENTNFYTMEVTPGSIDYLIYSNYVKPTEVVYKTVEDMIFADKFYDGASAESGKVSSMLGVVSSVGGKLVYNGEDEAYDLSIKFIEGNSVFFAMRATSDNPIWDGGLGYFFMTEKSENGVTVKLIKGVKEVANGEFKELASGTVDVALFNGEKHNLRLVAANEGTGVHCKFELDGKAVIDFVDNSDPLPIEKTHFSIIPGQSIPTYKLYAKNGVDIEIPENAYEVYTSKTLLNYVSLWKYEGGQIVAGESLNINHDQSRIIIDKVLKNAMFNFDLKINDLDNKWFAIYLNANKADALWNPGFRSNLIRIEKNALQIEYWGPQKTIATIPLTDVNTLEKMNVECGTYTVKAANGQDFMFIRVAINGKEYYNQPLMYDGAYTNDGCFGFYNYGCLYDILATETEVDKIPSGTNGQSVVREDETNMKSLAKTDSWAMISNSFDPSYIYNFENGEMTLAGKGDIVYANKVNFKKMSFKFRMAEDAEEKGQMVDFLFGRKRQQSFMGNTADNLTNYGYGLRVLPNGSITLIKTQSGSEFKTLMVYDRGMDTGKVFNDGQLHEIVVYRVKVDGGVEFRVFADDDKNGYSVIDKDYYEKNYPMEGYLSIANSNMDASITIAEVKFEGEEIIPEKTVMSDPLNFVTYYEDDEKGYLFFEHDRASYTTKWVEIYGLDTNNEYTVLLDRVFLPGHISKIPADYTGKSVKVVAVGFTEEGNWNLEVNLKDTMNDNIIVGKTERIKIAENENGAGFVYADSGKEFLPVGANYMSLRAGDHCTFDADTAFTKGFYDPIKTDAMMRQVKENGGNILRVFLIGRSSTNPGISGDTTIPVTDTTKYYNGLYIPYMKNVEHFLETAQKYGIYVMMALGDGEVPSNSYYMDLQGGVALNRNDMYFTENGIKARTTYAKNIMSYFKEKAPHLISSIFSIELQNEFAVYGDLAPFNQKAGKVTLCNGQTYDMGNADSRQKAFDESVTYYLNSMVKAIKDVDPDMLVNEGTFTLNIVGNGDVYGMQGFNSGDMRMPANLKVYLATDIDFLDMHIYFRATNKNTIMSSFAADLETMKYYDEDVTEMLKKKPIFMGEFGANYNTCPNWDKPNGDLPSAKDCLIETVRLAEESNFKGFAVWTLETHVQKDWWNLLAHDGTFETFRELVRVMHGVEEISGIEVENVEGQAGQENKILVNGLLEGDKVYYRISNGEWTETNPVFKEAGTYEVEYKVVRQYADDYIGKATVLVKGVITDVLADNVSVTVGNKVEITIKGIKDGDKITYRIGEGEWSDKLPEFKEIGSYKVEYKVVREGYVEFVGQVNVEIKEKAKAGCGSVLAGSAIISSMTALASVAFISKKKKSDD